jgi:DNA-binding MarR family transcriptional regulator
VTDTEGYRQHQPDSDEVAELANAAIDLQGIWDSAILDLGTTISPVQLRALLIIGRSDAISLNALAERSRASTSATSKLCDRLQQAGLVTRSKNSVDRRGVALSLSPAGERLVEWAEAQHRDRLRTVIDAMSPHGRAALIRGLNEFRLVLRQMT